MGQKPNAFESEPCFCYSRHANEICAVLRRLCTMSPLHSCERAAQVTQAFEQWRHSASPSLRHTHPVFFFVKDHVDPVPADFWTMLEKTEATLICVHLLA